jgi:aryl-alcohol dehydrogenase-like predicted oxidoreductase
VEVGRALQLNQEKEFLLSSKVGFASSKNEIELYVNKGLIRKNSFVRNHCLEKTFIENEINKNIKELKTNCIDILFLHNPEQQLEVKSKNEFIEQLLVAFETLEKFCQDGKIKHYGISTWSGFGINKKEKKFSLDEIIDVAQKVNGSQNNFKFIQLPLSLVHYDELYNCYVNGNGLLKEAKKNGINIFANSPLHKGELMNLIDDDFLSLFNVKSKSQACLLFLKSFSEIDTILVGATNKKQIDENIKIEELQNLESKNLEAILNLLENGE